MIRAGRLDRKIIIERATETISSMGHPSKTWSTHKERRAEVVPVSGAEAMKFEREVSSEILKFTIRYLGDLTVKDRIYYDSKYWDVEYFREIGRREGLEIIAKKVE